MSQIGEDLSFSLISYILKLKTTEFHILYYLMVGMRVDSILQITHGDILVSKTDSLLDSCCQDCQTVKHLNSEFWGQTFPPFSTFKMGIPDLSMKI